MSAKKATPVVKHRLTTARWAPTKHIGHVIEPTLIVVHDTASRLNKGGVVKYLQNNDRKVAYHIIIERDGEIVQLAPFDRKLNHAGRSAWKGRRWCNGFSIGIGLVNPGNLKGTAEKAKSWYGETFTADDGLASCDTAYHGKGHIWLKHTDLQLKSLATVIEALKSEYAITDVCGHYHVSPGRKIDPSPLVNLQSPVQPTDDPVEAAGDALAEQGGEPTRIEAEPADKVLSKTSREYKATNAAKTGLVTIGAGGGVVEALSAANIQGTKSYLDVVQGFVSDYGVFMLIGGCVVGWLLMEAIQEWKRQSYDDGRYEPSGEAG